MRRRALGWLGMLMVLGGCTTMRAEKARDVGDLLIAAGFQAKPADTPARMQQLELLPSLQVTRHVKDGRFVYAMADPVVCMCLYVGDEQAYAKYRQLALEKEIADENMDAAMVAQDAALDWGMWGPWWW